MSFHYDITLDVTFDNSCEGSGSDGLMEKGMENLLVILMTLRVLAKKHKQKWDFNKVKGDDDSEELESRFEIDEESGYNRNKYPIFKFPKKTWSAINGN